MKLNQLLSRFGKPPLKNMEAAGDRVFQDVFVRREGARLTPHVDAEPVRFTKSRLPVLAFALAAIVVVLVLVPLRQPDRQPENETIRASADASKVFNLADGSRVEMRAGSELSIERASDGVSLHLNQGKVTVHAAKQRNGHLYVRTRDLTVSVVGTVFFVEVAETGSRVGVLEGIVEVKHAETSRRLGAGEEFSTSPQSTSAEPEKLAALSQTRQSAAPSGNGFEAVSIRRNKSEQPPSFGSGGPGRFRATNVPIGDLLREAYDIQEYQLVGAPDWLDKERYDIEAKLENAAKRSEAEPLIQALLADRLKLKVHGEAKETSVFFLVPAKGGLKLKIGIKCNAPEPGASISQKRDYSRECGFMGGSDFSLEATSTTTADLTRALSRVVKRRVLDKTGYRAPFDVKLDWRPEGVGLEDPLLGKLPSIFVALEEELGLKLEPGKAPIDVLVIDHIERPSEN
jgi:uncharacterized protein (TIGR03435 family)